MKKSKHYLGHLVESLEMTDMNPRASVEKIYARTFKLKNIMLETFFKCFRVGKAVCKMGIIVCKVRSLWPLNFFIIKFFYVAGTSWALRNFFVIFHQRIKLELARLTPIMFKGEKNFSVTQVNLELHSLAVYESLIWTVFIIYYSGFSGINKKEAMLSD